MERAATSSDAVCVRDRVLDAAERVVGRDGVANFTLEAVANEAGVSKGGLLYHFRSKPALIMAVVDRLANRCERDQRAVLEEEPGGPGAFCRAYLGSRARPVNPEQRHIHAAILAAAGTDPQLLDPFRKRMAAWQACLEADGIPPEMATIVRLAIDGLCLCRLLGMPVPEGELRDKVVETLVGMTRPEEPCGDSSGRGNGDALQVGKTEHQENRQ